MINMCRLVVLHGEARTQTTIKLPVSGLNNVVWRKFASTIIYSGKSESPNAMTLTHKRLCHNRSSPFSRCIE